MNKTEIKSLTNIIYKKVLDIKETKYEIQKEKYYSRFLIDLEIEKAKINNVLHSFPNICSINYSFFGKIHFNLKLPLSLTKREEETIFNNWLENKEMVSLNIQMPKIEDIYDRIVIQCIKTQQKDLDIETLINNIANEFIEE